MKTFSLIAVLLTAGVLSARAATNDLTVTLQQGLFEEEANQNLDAAAQAYQSVGAQFDKDRKLAATAIFRLGEVYRKQGRTNEAAGQYERILREFTDQATLVTLSRQSLGDLKRNPPARNETAPMAADLIATKELEAAELAGELALLGKMSETDAINYLQRTQPNPVLTDLLKQSAQAEQTLAGLRQKYSSEHPEVQQAATLSGVIAKQITGQVQGAIRALDFKLAAAREALERLKKSSELSAVPARPANGESAMTEDEEKELRRVQALVQNSPDLINTGDDPPLLAAVRAGYLVVVRFLLEHDADINLMGKGRINGGLTAMHIAASTGQKGMVELLLKKGAKVNAETRTAFNPGITPLHAAAGAGYLAVAEALLNNRAEINARDERGNTPLFSAVGRPGNPVFTLLIARGADVNATNNQGDAVLYLAAADHVPALLAANANPTPPTETQPLVRMSGYGEVAAVKVLLKAGAKVNVRGKVVTGPQQNIQKFWSGLRYAVENGKTDVVKLLLENGATLKDAEEDASPIIFSTLSYPEVLTLLLEAGLNPNQTNAAGEIPLMGNISQASAKTLLAHGADPNLPTRSGSWPLLNAVVGKNVDVTRLLLEAKVEPNINKLDGWSVLHFAVNGGDSNIVQMLLSHGADPNAAARSPSASYSRVTSSGAFVTSRKRAEDTPLHLAAEVAALPIMELLLVNGADPNLRNATGSTPLDLVKSESSSPYPPLPGATARGMTSLGIEAAALLRKYGALDDMPDTTTVRIVRGPSTSAIVLRQDTATNNYYSLFEALAIFYARPENQSFQERTQPLQAPAGFAFPDFRRLRIQRLTGKKFNEREDILINALHATNGFDCAKDMPLKFGDIIEIPPREFSLAESASNLGPTPGEQKSLGECLRRTVRLTARSETVELPLTVPASYLSSVINLEHVRKILHSNSDLSRVKVRRRTLGSGTIREIITDATKNDLWLQDGDVVEVPDKP